MSYRKPAVECHLLALMPCGNVGFISRCFGLYWLQVSRRVSDWVTAGNAMNKIAGKGISVVAPAGGAYSLYTNWEQDGSKQWEPFV